MLHFKIVWGLRPLDPHQGCQCPGPAGEFPYPHLWHDKTQLKNYFGAVRRAQKVPKLICGLKNLFRQSNKPGTFFKSLRCKIGHPEQFLIYYRKNFVVPPGVLLQRSVLFCLSAFLPFCLSTFLLFCFSAFLLFCFSAFLLSAFQHFSFSAFSFTAFQLFCFKMNKREKCKNMSHRWPQCAKWFSRYPISMSGI